MIATMDDCFRPDLPIEVVRAQARVSKLVLERGLPPRLLTLCTYLVSTTNLARAGLVFISRDKVAGRIGLTERTIDRHLRELEDAGFLNRQTRDRSTGGLFFFGTCVKWTADLWDVLFVAPGRTRREAVAELRAQRQAQKSEPEKTAALTSCVNEPPHNASAPEVLSKPQQSEPSVHELTPTERPTPVSQFPVANQATFLAHYSSSPSTTVLKESFFNNCKQTKATISENTFADKPKPGLTAFNIPPDIRPWAQSLQLQPKHIGVLMATAKKTDPMRTKTRLQDLLNYVGDRLLRCSVLGDSASAYLYKCLASGEDYSQSRFNAPDAPGRDNPDEAAAKALRSKLPQGVVTVIEGAHLLRNECMVQRVDPTYGTNGECHLLNLAQQAVFARRAGLAEVTTNDHPLVGTVSRAPSSLAKIVSSQPMPLKLSYKDLRTAEMRKEFLSQPLETQQSFAATALTHLKSKGMAGASLTLKAEAGEWLAAPMLLTTMVTQYAERQYGPNWNVEPK